MDYLTEKTKQFCFTVFHFKTSRFFEKKMRLLAAPPPLADSLAKNASFFFYELPFDQRIYCLTVRTIKRLKGLGYVNFEV